MSFSIAKNYMGAEGAKYLAEALNVNSSMNSLDISSNRIGFDNSGHTSMTGIKAIADALSVSTSLNSLK